MMNAINAASKPLAASRGYRAYVLFILVVVYTFNFIDRQIVSILAVPIKAELALTDTQLSLMGGMAFALFYTIMGIPIALYADRNSRTWIMTIALTVWSAMTAICGLAQNFLQLFFARLGVGIGEAGGVAPAYSLIADYFPQEHRARALSIYSLGIPVGSALGIVFGGVIASIMDWRAAFIMVGIAGLIIAPLFKLTVREPVRGGMDNVKTNFEPVSFSAVIKLLSGKPSFWLLSLGAACSAMMGYGLVFWLPSFFVRSFGDLLPEFFQWLPVWMLPKNAGVLIYASYFYGTILLVGGTIGIWLGGVLADALGPKNKAMYALIPAFAFLAAGPCFLIGMMSQSLGTAFFIALIPTALSLLWLGPVLAAFQHLVPPNMRTTASAIFLFINNLIGIGLGNLVIGAISDSLYVRFGMESLRYAILAGTSFYFIAAVFFFFAAPKLKKDWES